MIFLAACGDDATSMPDASAPPMRVVSADLTVAEGGISDELVFEVPDDTRSVTIIVEGAQSALYALASLRTADGEEQVGVDLAVDPGPAMRASYDDEQIGHMEGNLYQSIRLGTFTHIYPYRPDQALPAGTTSLRVASDAAGPVTVTILMPEDDGAAVLHVNLIAVSETFSFPTNLAFMEEVQDLFAQAGITVVVDDVVMLPDTGLSTITDFTEPQETPESMSAMLPALVENDVSPAALDVFVVDSLAAGVGGLSLGTPGPPMRGSYYYGVVLRANLDGSLPRVLAHEVAHFLGLQHVQNVGISGTIYPDPLDDTIPGEDNLMASGTTLTADQAFSLSRSPLLQVD